MPDKEFFAVLNDPRIMPYRGEKVLLFRESSYWYEVEVVICNTLHHEQWNDFCNKHKVLYWVYLDKVDNLIQRPVKETLTNNWHTPDLPLWEGESYEKMNAGLKKPRARPVFKDIKICENCAASVKNEHGTMVGCLVLNKRLPAFSSSPQRRGFIRLAKDRINFPMCYTLTKPERQRISEPLPQRSTDKPEQEEEFEEDYDD
jgi:hypothetical protein